MSFYSDFAEYYESIFPFRDEVYFFLKSTMMDRGRRVLDVGCGPGHYCGRFTEDGFEAIGIDPDPAMIESAKRRYSKADFFRMKMQDVSALKCPRLFDLVFCIGNVAAHLRREEFEAFIEEVKNLLKPPGLWAFQVVNWDFILTLDSYHFPPKAVGNGDVVFLREYQDISKKGLRFRTCLRSRGKNIFEGTVPLYPVLAGDYLRMHRKAGFELIRHSSDYRGTPFDAASDSAAVFIFRKF